jgi:hypothetical protein
MPLDDARRCLQEVPHPGQLLVGVAREQPAAFSCERAIELTDLRAGLIRQLNHDLATVGSARSLDESLALQSIQQRGRGRARETDGRADLASGQGAIGEPVEAAEVGRVEAQRSSDGVVEAVGGALVRLGCAANGSDERLTVDWQSGILRY